MKFTDSVSIGSVKELEGGYLVATARVARTGVQYYLASELGDVALKAGFAPSDVVRVLRPAEQVFSADSLKSITRLPVTIDHPAEQVTADNWSQLAVGDVGDSYTKDGEWIVVNPMIKDSAGVQAAKSTHRKISMGYTADIVPLADRSIADFEQQNIRYNHLALVPKGRAGEMARIGDAWGATPVLDNEKGESPTNPQKGASDMELKTVVLGDKAVQVAVGDLAAIEAFESDMTKKLADSEAALTAAVAEKDEQIGTLKAELVKAQDAAKIDVDALVAARTELVAQVKAIDSAIEVAGKTDADLKKEAVAKKLGDAFVVNANDAEISGMFKALTAGVVAEKNPVADALKDGIKTVVTGDAAAADQAFAKSINNLNAWRDQ